MSPLATPVMDTQINDYGPDSHSEWLDIDWSAHQRWLEIDGRHANVIEIGEGPPLLLVHGLAACWQVWLENIPHLAKTHRVIALDLPGSGNSEMPQQPISIEGYVGFLANVLDQLDIRQTRIAGSSMGGLISAMLAATYPSRVEAAILCDPAGLSTYGFDNRVLINFAKTLHKLSTTTTKNPHNIVRRKRLRQIALGLVARYPDKLGPEHCYELLVSAGKPSFGPAFSAILGFDVRPHLAQIEAPTMVVWGGADRQINIRDSYTFVREIANAELKIYDDTGHAPFLERPRRFNRDADEFFASL